jgi:hypothetical protein
VVAGEAVGALGLLIDGVDGVDGVGGPSAVTLSNGGKP